MQPFLPLYVRELGVTDLGEAALLSGVAFAVAPLLSGLLAPFWGRWPTATGSRSWSSAR